MTEHPLGKEPNLLDAMNKILFELFDELETTEIRLNLDYDSNPEFRHWRPYNSRFGK